MGEFEPALSGASSESMFLGCTPIGCRGATFENPGNQRAILAASTSQPAILWIDDEAHPRDGSVMLPRMEGFRVDCAASGAEGLAMARARHYDGIFLDLRLPDLSGLDVLSQLRLDGNRVRVFVLTGFGDVESAIAAAEFGAALLHKPLFGDDLIATAKRLVHLERGPLSHPVPPLPAVDAGLPGDVAELLRTFEKLAFGDAPSFRRTLSMEAQFPGEARRGEARDPLLALLIRAMLEPRIRVPVFVACAAGWNRILTGSTPVGELAGDLRAAIRQSAARSSIPVRDNVSDSHRTAR